MLISQLDTQGNVKVDTHLNEPVLNGQAVDHPEQANN